MKYLVLSIYEFLVRTALFMFDRLIALTSAKHSCTVSFPSPGRAFAKKSQYEFITKDFLDDSGRIKDDVSIERLCPVCSAGSPGHFCHSQDGFEYVICVNCSMIYTSKILSPDADEIFQAKLLESEKMWSSEREEDKSADKERFFSYIRYLRKHVKDGSLLDIGCFTGNFLECARKAGFSPSGIEIHKDKAAVAASKGFSVRCGDFLKLDIREHYQVVTLWESLEHMIHPRSVVQKARSVLRNSGIIAFTVPNGDALSVKVLNGHLQWLGGFGHKNMFTPSAVAYLLKGCGFELVELKTLGGPETEAIINYFKDRIGSMDSFQNWLRLEEGVRQPSSARLLRVMMRPLVQHYNMGDLIFALARKV